MTITVVALIMKMTHVLNGLVMKEADWSFSVKDCGSPGTNQTKPDTTSPPWYEQDICIAYVWG